MEEKIYVDANKLDLNDQVCSIVFVHCKERRRTKILNVDGYK